MACGPECIVGERNLNINKRNGLYSNGRALPQIYRERILDLYNEGTSQRAIADEVRTSLGIVNKVIRQYEDNSIPFSHPRKCRDREKVTVEVVEYMESEKLCKPSTYTREIRQRLLLDGVSTPLNLPSESTIKKSLREDCFMTKKKISQVPAESLNPAVVEYTDYYLSKVSLLDFTKLHFFDESSVIITSGNRNYSTSHKGEPAIEVQRYASNANFTLNLLHSAEGVDYFSTLCGPSNGMEMVNCFHEGIQISRPDGSAVLELGDVIIMDNCGFHHGNFVEPLLRGILEEHGIRLFQPAYSPHLNTCEYCFHQIKCYRRQNTELTINETEIAVNEGVGEISASNSLGYFRKCGYID